MSVLGDIGNSYLSEFQQNPIAGSIISRYKRSQDQSTDPGSWKDMNSVYSQSQGAQDNPIQTPGLTDSSAIGRDPSSPYSQTSSVDATNAQIGNQDQWNAPSQPQKSGGGGILGAIGGFLGLARGGIVTQPTIAKLGESGPEAVVPLTPHPSNKLHPDLLEGHLASPQVPGMRLSRYRSYNRFGRGSAA